MSGYGITDDKTSVLIIRAGSRNYCVPPGLSNASIPVELATIYFTGQRFPWRNSTFVDQCHPNDGLCCSHITCTDRSIQDGWKSYQPTTVHKGCLQTTKLKRNAQRAMQYDVVEKWRRAGGWMPNTVIIVSTVKPVLPAKCEVENGRNTREELLRFSLSACGWCDPQVWIPWQSLMTKGTIYGSMVYRADVWSTTGYVRYLNITPIFQSTKP